MAVNFVCFMSEHHSFGIFLQESRIVRRLKTKSYEDLLKNQRMFIQQRFGGSLYDHGSQTAKSPPYGKTFHMILRYRARINGDMPQSGRLQLRLRLELSAVPSDLRLK